MIVTRPLVDADVDRAAAVLGEAFHDYPWTRWAIDGRDHVMRITELQRLALTHFGVPYGLPWVTTVDGTIECVALWFDSARRIPPEVAAALGDRFVELEGDRSAASAAADDEYHGWRPSERHLYLATMGTTPASQGRGLGARTLAPGLQFADEQGLVACLETSSEANVRFYSRLGFEAVRHWRIADGTGPDLWLMRREHRHRPVAAEGERSIT